MRIMFVVATLRYGGAERVVSILSKELIASGNEVGIYLTSPFTESAYSLDSNVNIFASQRVRKKLGLLKHIRRTVKKYNPDVVVPFMVYQYIYTALALLGTKYPVVVCERNDPNAFRDSGFFRLLARDLSFLVSKGAVFQSYGARNCFCKSIQNKSVVILNPLDINTMPIPFEGERENRIVTVGRLTKQKNHTLLIRAFSNVSLEFPNIILEIYGDGPDLEELQSLTRDLGISERVLFKGNVSDVFEKIKSAKLFAFSSDYEGLPNALVEALSMGMPCISTDCSPGGARSLINDGENGVLVPVKDVSAFSNALKLLLSDKDYASKIGSNALKLREKVASSYIASQWLNYFEIIINK